MYETKKKNQDSVFWGGYGDDACEPSGFWRNRSPGSKKKRLGDKQGQDILL